MTLALAEGMRSDEPKHVHVKHAQRPHSSTPPLTLSSNTGSQVLSSLVDHRHYVTGAMGDESDTNKREEHPDNLEPSGDTVPVDLAPWAAAIARQIVEAMGHVKERISTGTNPGTSGTSSKLH